MDMFKQLGLGVLWCVSSFCMGSLSAAVQSGEAAASFSIQDHLGKTVSLSDFKGKTVVLEWVNFQCPFVKKFYSVGEMQRLQADAKKSGVVWLSINSSAKGKQGNFDSEALVSKLKSNDVQSHAYLVDESGEVGKSYGAKTTPHMFVIDGEGTLVYQGAIDSIRSTNSSDIEKATNHVVAALEAVQKGEAPSVKKTRSYGCGVKY
jgi:peroxiredoxin